MRALSFAMLMVLCATLCAAQARAQAPIAIRYEIESNQVVQGESFELTVIVTTATDAALDELALPDLRDFTVLRESRASATQMQIRNGQRSLTVEQRFSYLLRAHEAGKAVIGGSSARLGKATAHAAALAIEVLPSADPSGATNTRARGVPSVERFGKNPPPAFLEVTVDKNDVVVGQQVTGTTELYTQQPLSQWPRVPGLKPQGFLCVSLLGDERPQPVQRSVAGRPYYVYLLNKDALFPLSAGELAVPAMRVDVVPAGSVFSRGRHLTAQSERHTITVRALPDEGKPARFSSANVGTFVLEVSVRPERVPLGQPVTLSIAAAGRGLLERIEPPTWDGGDVARVFPPTKKITRAQSDDVIAGRVTNEMLVQPHKEGTLTIPPLSWWVFDPEADSGKGAYVEKKSAPLTVKVVPAGRGKGAASSGDGHGGDNVVARGARPLKPRAHAQAHDDHPELPITLAMACTFAGAALRVGRGLFARRRTTERGLRTAAARERLKRVDDAATRGDLGALEQLLLDALASRCGAHVKSTTTGELASVLTSAGLAHARADEAVSAIRDLEALRYAPTDSGERMRVALRVQRLVRAIEEGA